ncbi:MAG TPA: hypothetical protein PKH24_10090 [Sedimentisphaerales bacterium]|jgi:hypothetical protein|nr:hypothetical protein [Sedimentisphaerales bacterium]HNU29480.1 hypothetical protein [Sedimentisphaerales bacterium]
MKSPNAIATVILVVAALVAAYAIGLLIRQARVRDSSSLAPEAAEVNETRIRESTAALDHAPGTRQSQDSQQARAKLKQKRAEDVEKMQSATEEQKEQFREKVRDRFTADPNARATRSRPLRRAAPAAIPAAQDRNPGLQDEKTGSDPNGR